ncbi:MAG: hypothetical protein HY272_08350 [Gammaproteobacteria bacterium]|nr:hypothetical protein [Gammaproteobacteria bacterium]
MSSPKFVAPLRVNLQGSLLAAVVLLVIYIGAIYWLKYLAIPGLLKFGLAALLVWSLAANFRRYVLLKHPRSVVELYCHSNEWDLKLANDQRCSAELLDSTFVSSWLLVLNFRIEGEKGVCSVVIAPGGTDSNSFRRLNVRLRRLDPAAI